jgi:ABC-type tungstate transport system substrate-binding protein
VVLWCVLSTSHLEVWKSLKISRLLLALPAQVMDMVKAGLLVSAMGVVILVSASFVLAPFIFDIDFGELPSWAVKQTPP